MNQKNNNMDLHVLKRFRQRFNVNWSKGDISDIIRSIQNSNSEPIYYLSTSRRVHIVEHRGIRFGCVYNKLRKRIHTVFPTEWIDSGSFVERMLASGSIEEVSHKKKVSYTMPLNNKNKRIVRGHYE